MGDSKGEIAVYEAPGEVALAARRGGGSSAAGVPAIVRVAGAAAGFAWEEFFEGELANQHTRKAYARSVRDFLAWAEGQRLDLVRITPGDVGSYLRALPWSVPTKKLRLAALRQNRPTDSAEEPENKEPGDGTAAAHPRPSTAGGGAGAAPLRPGRPPAGP